MRVLIAAVMLCCSSAAAIEVTASNRLSDREAADMYRADTLTVYRLTPEEGQAQSDVGAIIADGDTGTVVSAPEDAGGQGGKLNVGEESVPLRFHGRRVYRSRVTNDPAAIVRAVRGIDLAMTGEIGETKGFAPEYGLRFTTGEGHRDVIFSLTNMLLEMHSSESLPRDGAPADESLAVRMKVRDRTEAGVARTLEMILEVPADGSVSK